MATLIKKAVMVSFENYYSKLQDQLVVGTISEKKAIAAVKEDQRNRKCDIKKCVVLKNIDADEIDFDLDYAITLMKI